MHLPSILLAALAVTLPTLAPPVAHAAEPLTVIELYTSQGCSSCPPADAYLGDLARQKGVLALTLPVDYWDYLGWEDTLAMHEFSVRQRGYARLRGDGQVYTPQMVVDGIAHAVGSQPADVAQAIAQAKGALGSSSVEVSTSSKDGNLVIAVGAAPAGSKLTSGTILLAHVLSRAEVDIKRGENGGRKITYWNVVRELKPVGTWSGAPVEVKLSLGDLAKAAGDGCAVLLQAAPGGPILGATPIDMLPGS